jgi:hypothetical protein
MRTASTKIAALSVLGVLPGSKIEPNSINLVDIPNTKCECPGEAETEIETEGKRKNKRVLVIQPIPSQLFPTCFGARCTT